MVRSLPHRAAAAAALTALALGAASGASAQAQDDDERFRQSHRETLLISRAADGGWPNGPSRAPAISQDRQYARVVAYESDASNIVAGDANGATDVFAVYRRAPFSLEGEPWRARDTVLVSRSSTGARANGQSSAPDVDGDREHSPRCVAFLSDATNLVKGDTNRRRDAFVHDLKARRTTRVSLTGAGRQLAVDTTEVRIDGSCRYVAFVTGGGRERVYVRDVKGGRTHTIAAGNGDSYDVAITKRPEKVGGLPTVAFASEATDLDRRDRTARADVYVRKLGGSPRLVSFTRSGKPGNGPSDQPDISSAARFVAFRTAASDILSGDDNGVTDVARAEPGKLRATIWASLSAALAQPGNAASGAPAMGGNGSPIVFESLAGNLQGTVSSNTEFSDRNNAGDVFYWNIVSRNVSLQSRDSGNSIPNLPVSRQPHAAHAPALNPATATVGNYLLFDASYPLMDLDASGALKPQYANAQFQAATDSHGVAELRQVYLRYIGAR